MEGNEHMSHFVKERIRQIFTLPMHIHIDKDRGRVCGHVGESIHGFFFLRVWLSIVNVNIFYNDTLRLLACSFRVAHRQFTGM